MKKLIFLILILGIVFADIGPSPTAPSIEVILSENTDILLTYVCTVPSEGYDESPMGQREVIFSCSDGKCYNDDWFYKLNPCFDGEGYFTYKFNGEIKTTNTKTFETGYVYTMNLELSTGEFELGGEKHNDAVTCSLPIILLFSFLGFYKYV